MKKHAISILIVLILSGQLFGQSTFSFVDATVETVETIVLDGDIISRRRIESKTKKALLVETQTPNPLVEAYKESQPFPPVAIRGKQGRFSAVLAPGKWTVKVLDKLDSGEWVSEYLPITVPGNTEPDPLPDEPDDPGNPPPFIDWAPLEKQVAEFTDLQGLHTITEDPEMAKAWVAALEGIPDEILETTDLTEAKKIVSRANDVAFNRSHRVSWNPMIAMIGKYIQDQELKTTAEYAGAIEAVSNGLLKGLEQ